MYIHIYTYGLKLVRVSYSCNYDVVYSSDSRCICDFYLSSFVVVEMDMWKVLLLFALQGDERRDG